MNWPLGILISLSVTTTLAIVLILVMCPTANLGTRRFPMIWIFALVTYLALLMGTCAGLLQWDVHRREQLQQEREG